MPAQDESCTNSNKNSCAAHTTTLGASPSNDQIHENEPTLVEELLQQLANTVTLKHTGSKEPQDEGIRALHWSLTAFLREQSSQTISQDFRDEGIQALYLSLTAYIR